MSARTARYAAFLRGINLGRRRRVSGAELRSQFGRLGFDDVETFRTSGNVVFATDPEPVAQLAKRIEERLAASLGYEVGVFLRSAKEIRALAAHQPFTRKLLQTSKGKLQVMILSAKPSARSRSEVMELATVEDLLELGDRELYWLPSGGTGDSTLDLKAIDSLLGATTMRTKGTIDQLAAKYFAG
jgi:uncharacterized protein (DUF1697 family)